jgi:formylglycine-generating enzyme required for sulfatase activity
MKNIVFQIILWVLCLSAQAQKVSNIRAEQRGQDIVVLYSLETTSPCEVSLLLSQDNGITWSLPLKNVSGDVGGNISGGEKKIIWEVLEECDNLQQDNIKFKVVIGFNKTFEPEMVFVEGGNFKMGNAKGERNEQPVHEVTLSSFNIGKFEITQEQWIAVMRSNPSYFKNCDNCPVEQVSIKDVRKYLRKINKMTGKNYRLPTEAEWEYVAKGGVLAKEYTDSILNLADLAWYKLNSEKKIHPVGMKQANELGIYDLFGNVSEWCSDGFAQYSFYIEPNPRGLTKGVYNIVVRGGSWRDGMNICPESHRDSDYPTHRTNCRGFRVVLPTE